MRREFVEFLVLVHNGPPAQRTGGPRCLFRLLFAGSLFERRASDAGAGTTDRLAAVIVGGGMNDDGKAVGIGKLGLVMSAFEGRQGRVEFDIETAVAGHESVGQVARIVGIRIEETVHNLVALMHMRAGIGEFGIAAIAFVEMHATPAARKPLRLTRSSTPLGAFVTVTVPSAAPIGVSQFGGEPVLIRQRSSCQRPVVAAMKAARYGQSGVSCRLSLE